ncbi:MAG: hypothetical protein PHS41_12615 [Victivallaceae bacterium]|nr:hypothetical protein [Victivallaceae bacterium]
MPGEYLGHLSRRDPLYEFLKWEIFGQVGGTATDGIRVFRTNGSNAVYLYEDRATSCKVIGKFFRSEQMNCDWPSARRRMEREFANLNTIRQFLTDPHYVARPLGRNADLNCLLVVEHCGGESLDAVINRAIATGDNALLFDKLTSLAYFMASFHNRSARGEPLDFNANCSYMDSLDAMLGDSRLVGQNEIDELRWLHDRWKECPKMWELKFP